MKNYKDESKTRDRKRDRDGIQAKRKQARAAKSLRRDFEQNHADKNAK